MNTDDLSDRQVERLVDQADHHTVTVDLLTGADYGSGFYLHDDPAIELLEPGEQPHAILFNELKGVGIGSKRNTVSPDGSGATLFVITDRRLLILVGQTDGDRRFSVPFSEVTDADYSTGIMKNRVVVETTDEPFHLWVDASYDEADLEWVVNRLQRMAGSTDAGTDTGAGAPSPRSGSATANGTTADGGTGTDAGAGTTGTDADDTDAGAGTAADDGASGSAADGADSGGTDEPDPLDKLERLQELQEKGVLTEAEFEEKKRELLDKI